MKTRLKEKFYFKNVFHWIKGIVKTECNWAKSQEKLIEEVKAITGANYTIILEVIADAAVYKWV